MSNKTLLARVSARRRDVTVNDHVFTITRPKLAEISRDMTRMELCTRFVVGWDLKNSDLVPGGDPVAEPFDPDLWADYLEDDSDLWQPLGDAIADFYYEFLKQRDADLKN